MYFIFSFRHSLSTTIVESVLFLSLSLSPSFCIRVCISTYNYVVFFCANLSYQFSNRNRAKQLDEFYPRILEKKSFVHLFSVNFFEKIINFESQAQSKIPLIIQLNRDKVLGDFQQVYVST